MPQQPYGHQQQPGGYPPMPPAAPQRSTSGLAIAGLILAFLIAPLGLILSIIAAATTGARSRSKGRGLAVAGIIISLVIMAGTVATIVVIVKTVGDNISTVADPGCIQGKAAILNNVDAASDPDTFKEGAQATIDQLSDAAAKAKHDSVRDALNTVKGDYSEMLEDVKAGTPPPQDLLDKFQNDLNAVDDLCTIGS